MNTRRTEDLFRQNAINSLVANADGRPVAVMPKLWLLLASFCVAFVLGACVFLWSAEYARKETVRGWLVAQPGVVQISHSGIATVDRVERRAGDPVGRGDAIALLSSEAKLASGGDSARIILDRLHAQLAGADQREILAREQFVTDYRAFEAQVRGIDAELAALDDQEATQEGRVQRNAQKRKDLFDAVDRGAVARIELVRQQDEFAAMQQSAARLRQERRKLERERQGLLAAQERLGIELERGLAAIASDRSELQQRVARQEEQRLLILQSPVDGIVATLDVVAGSTIRPQQVLATVVPNNALLVAEVFVPSRAIGMIRPGQYVRLLYDAFPHQQFGTAVGQVDSIAGFVSLPADMPAASGLREAAYKVMISVSADFMEDEQKRYALRPGMALAAEIVLESRSLADWMLAPLKARF